MFVIDVTFKGNALSTETVYVRRPFVTVGAAEPAQIVVDEMEALGFDLHIHREVGRSFRVVPRGAEGAPAPAWVGGVFDGKTTLNLGDISLSVLALDLDLMPREAEPLDRAGIRIVRRAFSDRVPNFPALVITAPSRAVISFAPDHPVVIGRARQSSIRLDAPTVSLQHARVGFESGEFWVEDLGSTNGTFVGDKQVSSRLSVAPGMPIQLGKSAVIVGVVTEEQLHALDGGGATVGSRMAASLEKQYPTLVSASEAARPSRVALKRGSRIVIGRDPSCDLWLGAPHVSRRHCVVEVSPSGVVQVTDTSTNGTAYDDGMLRNAESFETGDRPFVLDFGAGVTVAVCFRAEQEDAFMARQGDPITFKQTSHAGDGSGQSSARRKTPRERKTTTWFNLQAINAQAPETSKGLRARVRMISSGLTPMGRVAIIAVLGGFGALLMVIGSMMVSGISK